MKVLPPITKDEYQQLEIYLFRLSEFTNSNTYMNMKPKQRMELDKELGYISMTVDILFRMYSRDLKEIPIVAWKLVPGEKDLWKRIHFFSCRRVASEALGVNRHKISEVIAGGRPHTGGYVFMPAEKYYKIEEMINKEPDWYNR
jgi:hypothetical protein